MGFPPQTPDTLRNQGKNPIESGCYAFDESTQHFFVKDDEHHYIQKKPYMDGYVGIRWVANRYAGNIKINMTTYGQQDHPEY